MQAQKKNELAHVIKFDWSGDARSKMYTRGVMPAYEDGEEWASNALEILDEYKTVVKLRTQSDVSDFLKGLYHVRNRRPQSCIWMTGGHKRAYNRIYNTVLSELKRQGVTIDGSKRGPPTLEFPTGEVSDCDKCNGDGYVVKDLENGGQSAKTCESCDGSGLVED